MRGDRRGFWQHLGAIAVKSPSIAVTRRDWFGASNIPAEGGVIVAANHLSEFDPLVVAHFILDAGRWPCFLAKSSLFEVPVLGPFLHRLQQIPVQRGTSHAASALASAAQALAAGHVVVIYPEGTTPKTGDLWPREGRTGLARLFLATGAPVIPVVTWGPQRVFDPRTRHWKLRPRTAVTGIAGTGLDLSAWRGAAASAEHLDAITRHVMEALRDLLASVRDPGFTRGSVQPAGAQPWRAARYRRDQS